MNYLEEISMLYESLGGSAYQVSNNQDYGGKYESKYSYSARGINGTKGADNFYSANLPTSVPVGEQEEDIIDTNISSKAVILEIKKLQEEADNEGMQYAVHILGRLKQLVDKIASTKPSGKA